MEWVSRLRGGTVCLDTAPLIYFIEEHPRYFREMRLFFEALDRGEFRVVTSTLTLLEVLVRPLQERQNELAALYRTILLSAEGLEIVSITPAIAEEAAAIRAQAQTNVPDAIQLAVARLHSAPLLTNDRRITTAAGAELILLDDVVRSI